MNFHIIVEEYLTSKGIYLGYAYCHDIKVEAHRADIKAVASDVIQKISSMYDAENLKNHPVIRSYRDIMWKLRIDPTKIRPSSEALVRRILRRKSFPLINNVVDSCNLASAETLIPISIFDANELSNPLMLRKALRGEEFIDFTHRIKKLKGTEIVLSDGSGNVLHLYPYRDSSYASIKDSTTNVLIISYGAPGVPKLLIREAVNKTINYLMAFGSCSGCSRIKIVS
jgi:DNA/RNA-binding domain of Phe-tRNA-synthetase-like protein